MIKVKSGATAGSKAKRRWRESLISLINRNYAGRLGLEFKLTGPGRPCAAGLGSKDLSAGCHSGDQL
jgi:hypothetical protein